MKESIKGYAVRITPIPGDNRYPWFASARDGTRFFAPKRKDAIAFKAELQQHMKSKCDVVKAVLTIELAD